MNFIFGWFQRLYDFIILGPWSLVLDFMDWVIQLITVRLPQAIWLMMPTGLAEYLQSFDLTPLQDIVGPVTWFFPIWTIMILYATAYSFAATIRLVRFIIGFIPTIDG